MLGHRATKCKNLGSVVRLLSYNYSINSSLLLETKFPNAQRIILTLFFPISYRHNIYLVTTICRGPDSGSFALWIAYAS